ncbi:MAG: acetylornithine transaminase [Burkholderiaceae bacterium]
MNQTNPFSSQALMPITTRPPVVFARGQGSWLWDEDDNRYLDFVQGWAVNSLGHCPEQIINALNTQASQLISPSPAYFNRPAAELAGLIVANSSFDHVFLASSGAEANEGAIKLARRWGQPQGRHEIITFEHSFHGRTLATMSASGKPAFKPLFEPKVSGFPKAKLNDLESVKRLISDQTVAVMLEPIQGEAGVLLAEDEFLQQLRALTTEHGLLLIVDEIQTGVARTGKLWGHEWAGIKPDVMTLGKGLGGGVPLSALVATREASCFEPGDQGGTYCGNPLMAAVGSAILNTVMDPTMLAAINQKSTRLTTALTALSKRYGLGAPRGRGLLIALDLKSDIANQVVSDALDGGLLINAPRADTLRFMPALTVSFEEIDQMISLLDKAIARSK